MSNTTITTAKESDASSSSATAPTSAASASITEKLDQHLAMSSMLRNPPARLKLGAVVGPNTNRDENYDDDDGEYGSNSEDNESGEEEVKEQKEKKEQKKKEKQLATAVTISTLSPKELIKQMKSLVKREFVKPDAEYGLTWSCQKPLSLVCLDNGQPLPTDAQALYDLGKVSPFGDMKTATTKVDETVRMAHEIPMTMHNLTPEGKVFFRHLEQSLTDEPMYRDRDAVIVPHKLNIYPVGGHFQAHQDTSRDGVQGSLVIELPYARTGGDLIVHKGKESFGEYKTNDGSTTRATVFYSNCKHEVTKVTAGFRVSLACHLKQPERCPFLGRGGSCYTGDRYNNVQRCRLGTLAEHQEYERMWSEKKKDDKRFDWYTHNTVVRRLEEFQKKADRDFQLNPVLAYMDLHNIPRPGTPEHKLKVDSLTLGREIGLKPKESDEKDDIPTLECSYKNCLAIAFPNWGKTEELKWVRQAVEDAENDVQLLARTPMVEQTFKEYAEAYMRQTKSPFGVLLSDSYSYDELNLGLWKVADHLFMNNIDPTWETQILPVIVRRVGSWPIEGRRSDISVDETVFRALSSDFDSLVSKKAPAVSLPAGAPAIPFLHISAERKSLYKEEDEGAEHTGNESRDRTCDNTYFQVAVLCRIKGVTMPSPVKKRKRTTNTKGKKQSKEQTAMPVNSNTSVSSASSASSSSSVAAATP